MFTDYRSNRSIEGTDILPSHVGWHYNWSQLVGPSVVVDIATSTNANLLYLFLSTIWPNMRYDSIIHVCPLIAACCQRNPSSLRSLLLPPSIPGQSWRPCLVHYRAIWRVVWHLSLIAQSQSLQALTLSDVSLRELICWQWYVHPLNKKMGEYQSALLRLVGMKDIWLTGVVGKMWVWFTLFISLSSINLRVLVVALPAISKASVEWIGLYDQPDRQPRTRGCSQRWTCHSWLQMSTKI